jgi:hypothetical protein
MMLVAVEVLLLIHADWAVSVTEKRRRSGCCCCCAFSHSHGAAAAAVVMPGPSSAHQTTGCAPRTVPTATSATPTSDFTIMTNEEEALELFSVLFQSLFEPLLLLHQHTQALPPLLRRYVPRPKVFAITP